MSAAEEAFAAAWAAAPLEGGEPVREYRFHPTRKFRFDFAWPAIKLALEIDGRGRHQTVVGVRADCEKLNEAIRLGWRVMRVPASDKARAAEWVEMVKEVMCGTAEL